MSWIVFFLVMGTAFGAEDGGSLFNQHCAVCHRNPPVNRAPLLEALQQLSKDAILNSMVAGSMREPSAKLTMEQKTAIAEFLARPATTRPAGAGFCPPGHKPRPDMSSWTGWGADVANTRFQPAALAGLSAGQIAKLQLKWAFGFAGASAALAQPVARKGKLYFGSQNGTVYAADARTGCVFWTFKAPAAVRTAIAVAAVENSRQLALFGDAQANVFAVDLEQGRQIWRTKVDEHPVARITGALALDGSRLFVPVSSVEEVSGGNPKYECCKFRGSIVALDAASGRIIWKTYMIPDPPQPTRKNSAGVQLYGPSGAAVWLSPTLDIEKGVLYVGTGNAYSDPLTQYSNAVIALEMKTGRMLWVRQLTPGDGWNFSCINPNKANCPESAGPDVDIGASPILRALKGGKRVLVVGQKSGVVHGLDPDAGGKILWQTRVGVGGALGGVQWGMAADEEHLYVAVSDVHLREKAGGLFALRLTNGEVVWHAPPSRPPCAGKPGCTPAQMGAVTAIPGVVFSGAMDGVLRAWETHTGRLIWEFDTARDFETVNGVKARGGSLSGSGPVVAGGMVFVNSGYGILGGMPGNVLLALAPEDR